MIKSFLLEEHEDDLTIDKNVEAVNQAMVESKFKKAELEKLKISPMDVTKMRELLKILDVLEEGITLIGGEKFSTASAVLPFLSRFDHLLELDENEPLYISSFKQNLRKEMNTRCDANLNRKVLLKASFFDFLV